MSGADSIPVSSPSAVVECAVVREQIERVGLTVAIDGPAGSGKSTVAKAVADRLGIGFLDTGAMYRALTWFALERGMNLGDHEAVAALAPVMPLVLDAHPHAPRVWVGEDDVTSAIRQTRISEAVSEVSTNLSVRSWMVTEQRRRMHEAAAQGSGMVAEGRDITTVVCPDANVRVLLTARPEARMRRRALELFGDASEASIERVRQQVVERDAKDSTVADFMTPAPGVVEVDTSDLDIEGVIGRLLELIAEDVAARFAATTQV